MNFFDESNCAIECYLDEDSYVAKAPANIALIKYMGKDQYAGPTNASISYTLKNFTVTVSITPGCQWSWQPLEKNIVLTELQQERFINHAKFLAQELNINDKFILKSAGNFPKNCGIASSAASFAALTAAFGYYASKDQQVSMSLITNLSAKGSGSSCRSFFSGWVIWQSEVYCYLKGFRNCISQVVVVCENAKKVSSSSAHQRVLTSDLFNGRSNRANKRLQQLLQALDKKDWRSLFNLAWQDFWDMHGLFHTSTPAFSYLKPATIEVLNFVQDYWEKHNDGPIATLDAGANIHLLYREDQIGQSIFFKKQLSQNYKVIG